MKKILLISALGLLITACGGPETPAPSAVTSVSGTVVEDNTPADQYTLVTKAWTGGAGTVYGFVGTSTTEQNLGALAASGAFTVSLPSTVDAALLTTSDYELAQDTCDGQVTGTVNVSNPAAKGVGMMLAVDAAKDGMISPSLYSGDFNEQAKTADLALSFGSVIYVDQAVTVTGTQSCPSSFMNIPTTLQVKSALNLAKGWNLVNLSLNVHLDANTGKGTGTINIASGSLSTDKWLFQEVTPTAMKGMSNSQRSALHASQDILKRFLW